MTRTVLTPVRVPQLQIVQVDPAQAAAYTRRAASGQAGNLHEWQTEAGVLLTRIDPDGYLLTRKTAAPADAALVNGELGLYLDATAGSPRPQVKLKDASGGVLILTLEGYSEVGENLLSYDDSTVEGGTGSWGNAANVSSIVRSTTFAYAGSSSLKWTALATGVGAVITNNLRPVRARAQVSVLFRGRTDATSARSMNAAAWWYDSTGAFVSGSAGDAIAVNNAGWAEGWGTFVVPDGIFYAQMVMYATDALAGESFYTDSHSLAPGASRIYREPAKAVEVILDEAVARPFRRSLNFTGAAVSATDDLANDRTNVAVDAVQATLLDAKGDLIAASAADTPARVPVGTDGFALAARSSATNGVAWETPNKLLGITKLTASGTSAVRSSATAIGMSVTFTMPTLLTGQRVRIDTIAFDLSFGANVASPELTSQLWFSGSGLTTTQFAGLLIRGGATSTVQPFPCVFGYLDNAQVAAGISVTVEVRGISSIATTYQFVATATSPAYITASVT